MSDSLFADEESAATGPPAAADAPLAERLRPRTLAEVIGQLHLLAPGKPVAAAFAAGRLHSMILWGPPGVGKTTLARLVAGAFAAEFIVISAVLGGVKDIREAVERAQTARRAGRASIVFVDEVHRFNKSQQDAFLPHVESGLFTFIGATTENPSFEVNSALLSRATVHVLQPLGASELAELLERARIAVALPPFSAPATDRLISYADGDARRLLNAVENLAAVADGAREVDESLLERALGEQLRRYDKGGDVFYDTISALHKSVRGSDPDAALYWLARMLTAGEDPRFISRRLVIFASEDVGMADPLALVVAEAAARAVEFIGMPEAQLNLAQATVHLSTAPKSNRTALGIWSAMADVKERSAGAVPIHLRDAHYAGAKKLGHGKGYQYPHDAPDGWVQQQYLPDDLIDRRYYEPSTHGHEGRVAERMRNRDQLP